MRKSTLAVLAAGLSLLTVAAGALVLPSAVSAKTQETIVVGPNQRIDITKPGLPGVGYAYGRQGNVGRYRPENCRDGGTGEAVCDYFPLRADVTPEQQRRNIYLLLVNLDWPGENVSVPLVITAANPQLTLNIWEDPIVEDEEPTPPCPEDGELVEGTGIPDVAGANCPAAEEKPGGDEPLFQTSIGDPKPLRWGYLLPADKNTFSVIVTNYAGSNDKYTLTVELVQVEGTPDLSIDGDLVDLSAVDQSVDPGGAPTSGFDGSSTPAGAAGGNFAALGLAELGADSQLDRLGLQGDDALGFDEDAAALLANRNLRNIRPPGDEAAWALILWLVVVPIAIAGAAVYWGLRRRSTLLANI